MITFVVYIEDISHLNTLRKKPTHIVCVYSNLSLLFLRCDKNWLCIQSPFIAQQRTASSSCDC